MYMCRKDTFSIQCSDLGELTKVKVRHDNSGSGPSWLLDSIGVKCEDTRERDGASDERPRVWQFPCGQWLEMCEGCGGKLEVELKVGGQSDNKSTPNKEKGILYIQIKFTCTIVSRVSAHGCLNITQDFGPHGCLPGI